MDGEQMTTNESVESKSFYQRHPILSTLGFISVAIVSGAAGGAAIGAMTGFAGGTAGSMFILKTAATKGATGGLTSLLPATKAGLFCL